MLPLGISVLLADSYWKTMAGPRGYFTHAIPVEGRELYAAKVLFAYPVILLSILVGLLSFGIAIGANFIGSGMSVSDMMDAFSEWLAAMPTSLLVFFIVVSLLQALAFVVSCASIMSIGAEGRWNRYGFGAPAVGFVILYMVSQVVSIVGTFFIPILLDISTGGVRFEFMLPGFFDAVAADAEPQGIGIGGALLYVLLAIVLAWWGIRSIEKRTSLR